jgi:hypothetical protein
VCAEVGPNLLPDLPLERIQFPPVCKGRGELLLRAADLGHQPVWHCDAPFEKRGATQGWAERAVPGCSTPVPSMATPTTLNPTTLSPTTTTPTTSPTATPSSTPPSASPTATPTDGDSINLADRCPDDGDSFGLADRCSDDDDAYGLADCYTDDVDSYDGFVPLCTPLCTGLVSFCSGSAPPCTAEQVELVSTPRVPTHLPSEHHLPPHHG